jgi:hypothetical protein
MHHQGRACRHPPPDRAQHRHRDINPILRSAGLFFWLFNARQQEEARDVLFCKKNRKFWQSRPSLASRGRCAGKLHDAGDIGLALASTSFLKKRSKKLLDVLLRFIREAAAQTRKSFLVLFFKKELLPRYNLR